MILLTDYASQNIGGKTTISISGDVPSTGLAYITIHLDYGLKRTENWTQFVEVDESETAENLTVGDGLVRITSPQQYFFFSTDGSVVDQASAHSVNNFKKIPGFGGAATLVSSGNPISGATVEIWGPEGLLDSVMTDEDGVYLYVYKHKGRPTDYVLKLMPMGEEHIVTAKSNSFNLENFEILEEP